MLKEDLLMNLDNYAAGLFAKNINMMVPWYLMASYAYYVQDDAIFSDGFFDEMGKTMLACWNDIEHYHKEHITQGDLQAGTFLGEYPSRVEGGLSSVRKEFFTKAGKVKAKYAQKNK
jgi:hypothetical protein